MKWIIAGLGNPGGEYAKTRHNTGRIILEAFQLTNDFPEWKFKSTYRAMYSQGRIGGDELLLIAPETYMNDSGKSLMTLVKSKKQASQLIIIHDDIDLPLGTWKISWNKNSGGHNGVESVVRTLKTKEFVRIRVGISPISENGIFDKPKGEEEVIKFVLGKFRARELIVLQKISKEIIVALPTLCSEGIGIAMNRFNS